MGFGWKKSDMDRQIAGLTFVAILWGVWIFVASCACR